MEGQKIDNFSIVCLTIGYILWGTYGPQASSAKKSPELPPHNNTYRGNWRPHHKEFSKEELKFILDYSGFEIVKHEYFDRKQSDYFIDKKNNTIRKHKIKKNLKNIIFELIKNTGFLVPHLRNHHIILAKKIKNNEIIQNRKTTSSLKEFMEIRKNTLSY